MSPEEILALANINPEFEEVTPNPSKAQLQTGIPLTQP
jgi:hypothetical protein